MRLRTKMTAVVTAVTAAALGSTFAVISWSFNTNQRDQLDAEILAVARTEAHEAPSNGFDFSDRPGPAANDVGPLTKHGIIYDAGGTVLGATHGFLPHPPARSSFAQPVGRCFDFWHTSHHFRGVIVPIQNHPGKELLLSASREDLDGDERFLRRAMLLAFLAALAWVGCVTWWSFSKLTKNHARIAEIARRVADGDMSARVALQRGDPETTQLGQDIDQMIEKLSSLMTSQQRFISQAAHELRSPLTQLYGELQFALRRDREKEVYRRSISEALEATRKLKLLAEDLLALARVPIPAGIDPEPVVVADAVDEARSLLGDQIQTREVAIHPHGPACAALARKQDVVRVLRNLIENAAAHSPPQGCVSIVWQVSPVRVRILVQDQGAGIADDEQPRVFEPFFRGAAERSSNRTGAGLGLAIARELARAHGGDVVLTESGKTGACFCAEFPAAPRWSP